MLKIDPFGMLINPKIKHKRFLGIEKKTMTHINGLVVHQTHSSTSQETFNSYTNGSNGAHFLIDKDGTIYQTASILKSTNHVGKIKSRCFVEHRCDPVETEKIGKMSFSQRVKYFAVEKKKKFPNRYPMNADSIGIEIVGKALSNKDPQKGPVYETLTAEQNASLKWLLQELSMSLSISMKEIYRHPEIGYKNPTEASSAQW